MSRFRFRVWDKDKNRMEYDDLGAYCNVDVGMTLCYDDCLLMQCTGLKDKNGKDIYEGDILQVGKEYSGTFNPTYVTFEDGSFRHQISHMHNPVVLNSAIVMVLEVIGNIYENPELLEGEQ